MWDALRSLQCGSATWSSRSQPARGYNIDPEKSYHDPDLPPPHGYLAFYAWVRSAFDAHAVVHVGKHGNVEWLPGKALALSAECFPEAALGPLPHVYPFIVNDPGEGSQAKRRGAAVIVDHLTPPLTRAGSHGALEELERLVDEFFDAASVDPRRCPPLSARILELAASIGLDQDCGIHATDGSGDALRKLDGYLCEIKEMQIRDGLHIFGEAPAPERRNELLRAIARSVRGPGAGEASLLRALADDLVLGIDPLSAPLGEPWRGPRPQALTNGVPWRSTGDTVERLETLAASLIAGSRRLPAEWRASTAVMHEVTETIGPALDASADAETAGLLTALDGRFVAPGAAGAPTRGRPDVLPTGRNFYSVDTRQVPTAAAWQLGWASAQLLVEHYAQTHGDWPRAMALSAWGTSNMRTGGDDIAQALALIGARPRWEGPSGRVTGFEIMPLDPARPAQSRCDAPGLGLLPRRLSGPDRPLRFRGARGCGPRRERGRQPARRQGRRRRGPARRRRRAREPGPAPGLLPSLRLEARRLRCRPAGTDRRARLGGRQRPRPGLRCLGRLGLRRGRRGCGRALRSSNAASVRSNW